MVVLKKMIYSKTNNRRGVLMKDMILTESSMFRLELMDAFHLVYSGGT
jgi:hypothetical protein